MENAAAKPCFWSRIAPALTLIVLAPLVAEVLPGYTRMSAAFVFPIEMGVWGVGALLIRAAVRHWRLGWRNMLLLALALGLAEEFVIQQSSLAPMVIQIVKGEHYARAFDVNWIYLLWALGFEAVLVVFLPVTLVELIYRRRREQAWVSKAGLAVSVLTFAVASVFAWFMWTQIARPKVFHVPAYVPPAETVAIGVALIILLIFVAIGPLRRCVAKASKPLSTPPAILLALFALVVSALWYGLVLLGFNIRPDFPVPVAAAVGILLVLFALLTFPRWAAHQRWSEWHRFAVVCGTMLGTMGTGFIPFIFYAPPLDLYGKVVLNGLAVIFLIGLALKLRRPVPASTP